MSMSTVKSIYIRTDMQLIQSLNDITSHDVVAVVEKIISSDDSPQQIKWQVVTTYTERGL